MESFSQRYFSYMETAKSGIAGACGDLHRHGLTRFVQPWFRFFYAVIRATTPLLQFALEQLRDRSDDEFCAKLRDYFLLKLEDEGGHDEMLLRDLAHFGISEGELNRTLPPAPITALVGSQYYLIAYHHPAIHLGYAGLLEGCAPSVGDVRALIDQTGTGADPWSTYMLHAEIDTDHRRDLVAILDAVPDDDELRRAIIANGLRTAEYYCQALESLVQDEAISA